MSRGPSDLVAARRRANFARFEPGQRRGHYESFFVRANHPTRPLAFWIRYTLVSPVGRPLEALGELWAIWFDGETGKHVALKKEVPIHSTRFDREAYRVDVDEATMSPGRAYGSIGAVSRGIGWDLAYRGGEEPLFLFPIGLYDLPFPKAKTLVGAPSVIFEGAITVMGESFDVTGWLGSQNHNWGEKHTDHYAWGQVAGFDGHPESFLEVATARLRIGPIWTPFLTPMVLRHEGREISINAVGEAVQATAEVPSGPPLDWRFRSVASTPGELTIEGSIRAEPADFVGLWYANPPGGRKRCHNSKIATCDLRLTHPGGRTEVLRAERRAAFEILCDGAIEGVPMRV